MITSARFSLALAALSTAVAATSVDFVNRCDHAIELYHSQEGSAVAKVADISTGATISQEITGPAHMFRHGESPAATLVELACDSNVWYDVSIIPPMTGNCGSFDACKAASDKHGIGFNVAVAMNPKTNVGSGSCAPLSCTGYDADACQDGYLFPADNSKTHSCPSGTAFEVVFCPGGGSGYTTNEVASDADADAAATVAPYGDDNSATSSKAGSNATEPESTKAPSSSSSSSKDSSTVTPKTTSYDGTFEVRSKYSYVGKEAGNVDGGYDQVTSLNGCVKTPVKLNNPVGPMSEEVTMVFRGPMAISDIAVYTSEGGNSSWKRDSVYSSDSGYTENIVFMNNQNVDYSGEGKHGPQGCASEDGKSLAEQPTVFGGYLAEASNPPNLYGGPGIATGAEINIMTSKKCNGDCFGYAESNDYHGWGGSKKIFVTRVKMPQGGKPNQPAIWMLNAQVVHSNQYGCNCRGMGSVGGCGELDIAEVIETNAARDRVSTHYYFYDGSVVSPGGDNFAPRPFNEFTVYVVIINGEGDGLIKIIEISDHDFSADTLDEGLYSKLVSA